MRRRSRAPAGIAGAVFWRGVIAVRVGGVCVTGRSAPHRACVVECQWQQGGGRREGASVIFAG